MKLDLTNINKIFVTSDTHYCHKNICRGVSEWKVDEHQSGNDLPTRDFDTLEEMNQALVDNINSKVPKDGILIHLGDWSFGGEDKIKEFRSQLKVQIIHLVTGNHDHHIEKGKWDHLFSSRDSQLKLFIGRLNFHMHHHPFLSWDGLGKGWYHLHGHQHWKGDLKFGNGRMMDVGMDGNNLFPYSLIEVIDLLKDRKRIDTNDHHSK